MSKSYSGLKTNSRGEVLRYDGYRKFTELEKYFFEKAGDRFFFLVIESSFRYSCLEAEYLNMAKIGDEFIKLCDTNRELACYHALEKIYDLESISDGAADFKFKSLTDEDIKKDIAHFHKR